MGGSFRGPSHSLFGTVLSGAIKRRSALKATGREWWASSTRESETFPDSDQFSFSGFGNPAEDGKASSQNRNKSLVLI